MDLGRIRRQCCGHTGEITVTRRSASRYKLPAAVTQYGRNEKLFTFIDEIAADLPRKQRLSDYDQCAARSAPICPRCFDSYGTRRQRPQSLPTLRGYEPTLPSSAARISSSVGLGFSASSAGALMIKPLVQ
jgi:hypothetical protein